MTEPRNFMQLLRARMAEGKSLCVGLDSDVAKIPERLVNRYGGDAQFEFNREIINATKDIVVAYKINIAFYRDSEDGRDQLLKTITYIREIAPDVPIILDAKRMDIGNTNEGYTFEAFSWFGADAVTVNPYFGFEQGLDTFVRHENKGVIILCRTSNPGAGDLQNRQVEVSHEELKRWGLEIGHPDSAERMRFYQLVAHKAAKEWNDKGNVCVVAGATAPIELATIRRIVGDMPILIPGYGAQGAEIKDIVPVAMDSTGNGMIINASRSIIFADDPGQEARRAHNEIIRYREN